jgi:hypothetical protein
LKTRFSFCSATKIEAKEIPGSGASLETTAAAQGSPTQCPAKETKGARGPKSPGAKTTQPGGPVLRTHLSEEELFSSPSSSTSSSSSSSSSSTTLTLLDCPAPSGRRAGGTPIRRACVPHYLGHATEGNPCRMLVPPYQYPSLKWQCWWLNSSKDAQQERENHLKKGGESMFVKRKRKIHNATCSWLHEKMEKGKSI